MAHVSNWHNHRIQAKTILWEVWAADEGRRTLTTEEDVWLRSFKGNEKLDAIDAAMRLAGVTCEVRSIDGIEERAAAIRLAMAKDAETHAREWEMLAEEADMQNGQAARNRAATYRRTAKAFRLEVKTGRPHCSCCLKPQGPHT